MAHMCAGNNRRLKQICGEPLLICERVSVSVKQPRHEPLLPRLRARKAQTVATRWQPPRGCGLQQLCFIALICCSTFLQPQICFTVYMAIASLVWSLCQCSVLADATASWEQYKRKAGSDTPSPPPPPPPPTLSAAGIQP